MGLLSVGGFLDGLCQGQLIKQPAIPGPRVAQDTWEQGLSGACPQSPPSSTPKETMQPSMTSWTKAALKGKQGKAKWAWRGCQTPRDGTGSWTHTLGDAVVCSRHLFHSKLERAVGVGPPSSLPRCCGEGVSRGTPPRGGASGSPGRAG